MKHLIYFLPLLLLYSCSESAQELVDNHQAEAEEKFNQFYACYEIAKSTPTLTENKIDWEEEDACIEYGEKNVYPISIEHFKDLATPLDIEFSGVARSNHSDIARLYNIDLTDKAEEHTHPYWEDYSYHEISSGESCATAIRHFLESKYLLMTRLSDYVPADLVGTEYVPGVVEGDVLVFDLAKGKLLGGYTYRAESRSHVEPGENETGDEALVRNLNTMVDLEIGAQFIKLCPFIEDQTFTF